MKGAFAQKGAAGIIFDIGSGALAEFFSVIPGVKKTSGVFLQKVT